MIDLDRRRLGTVLGAAAFGAGLGVQPIAAQTAALEVISAVNPGEGDDQLARAVAEGLTSSKLLPSADAVNIPGDGGGVALRLFAAGKRPRAGLLVFGLGTIGSLIVENQTQPLSDCRPLGRLTGELQPIVVAFTSPIRTLEELIRRARDDAGSLKWGGRLRGGFDHQLVIQFVAAAGGDTRRIHYVAIDRDAEVFRRLMDGEIDVATGDLGDLLQQIRGGTLRALGLSSDERAPGVDIPTFREQGLELASVHWRGVLTRTRMDETLVARFGAGIGKLVSVPGWKQLLEQRHWADLYLDVGKFTPFCIDERLRVEALFRRAGVI